MKDLFGKLKSSINDILPDKLKFEEEEEEIEEIEIDQDTIDETIEATQQFDLSQMENETEPAIQAVGDDIDEDYDDEDEDDDIDEETAKRKKILKIVIAAAVVLLLLDELFPTGDESEDIVEAPAPVKKERRIRKRPKKKKEPVVAEKPAVENTIPVEEANIVEKPSEVINSEEPVVAVNDSPKVEPVKNDPIIEDVKVEADIEPTPEVKTEMEIKKEQEVLEDIALGEENNDLNDLKDELIDNEIDKIISVVNKEKANKKEKHDMVKSVVYSKPPTYIEQGRGLVYNCKDKFWACVDRDSYFKCEDNYKWSRQESKIPECSIVNVYATYEDCRTVQTYNINMMTKTPFCNKDYKEPKKN